MVVFVDLDDEIEPPESLTPHWSDPRFEDAARIKEKLAYEVVEDATDGKGGNANVAVKDKDEAIARRNLNRNAVTEVFACYPIVTLLTRNIDLNTLSHLSLTCRQIRMNLLQFRSQLISQTLRCENEDLDLNSDNTLRYRARAADWYFMEDGGAGNGKEGKAGYCAKDLVGECRRCGKVVCRNCTIKPPAPYLLQHRHRRLCPTCIKAPLPALASPALSSPSPAPPLQPLLHDHLARSICSCASSTYLCQPCGRSLRSADSTYESIWRWRTRYGPALGGLGTGIGEGNRSFECGRGADCGAARIVEEERDCAAEDARSVGVAAAGSGAYYRGVGVDAVGLSGADRLGSVGSPPSVGGSAASPDAAAGGTPLSNRSSEGSGSEGSSSDRESHSESPTRDRHRPGYSRHEIEGIGGVVKTKLVRMVKVGACVSEWEAEREGGKYLDLEARGEVRSWCGWCHRVVPGRKDREVWGL